MNYRGLVRVTDGVKASNFIWRHDWLYVKGMPGYEPIGYMIDRTNSAMGLTMFSAQVTAMDANGERYSVRTSPTADYYDACRDAQDWCVENWEDVQRGMIKK